MKDPNTSAATAVASIVGYQARDVMEPVIGYREGTWDITERGHEDFRRVFGPVQQMPNTPPGKLRPPTKKGSATGNTTYEEIVPSYTVMFVFFLVNLMGRSFIAEREIGTLRRLRAAPISGWSILLGKTLPFLTVSLIQTAILFLAGKLIFGMSWGTAPWMLLPVIVATSCAATGLGLLIATLVKTESQVSAYATFTVIILAGVSGCFMPRKWLPDVMQQISLATPHAWALIAYDELLSAPSPSVAIVWQCVGMLLAFAAGFFILGGWRFRSVG
jgi:ABC-2 type transport system permease protein